MPISDIQADVLRTIAAHRSPESYLAGATVLHRHADSPRYSQDLQAMKQQWCRAQDEARALAAALPPEELGCLYLAAGHRPGTPLPHASDASGLSRQRGSIRGAWPTVTPA